MTQVKSKKILFACMDWGLGHATRSVPLIKQLQQEGHHVTLASAGSALTFLKNYFPELKCLEKPAYNIRYSSRFSVTTMLFFQSSSFFKTINSEKKWLKKAITNFGFEEIYSDNCYGLYNQNVPSTIITHQLMVKCPSGLKFLESFLHRKIISYTNKFTRCWVPDYEGENNLSGDLSHKYPFPKNVLFIGPLSRFIKPVDEITEFEYAFCAILSGPEPSRTQLENHCLFLFKNIDKKCLIIRGLPENEKELVVEGIDIYNHLNDEEFSDKVRKSAKIICRSGYSTIMDLKVLGKRAVFIPTPGQTEQEYLAFLHRH